MKSFLFTKCDGIRLNIYRTLICLLNSIGIMVFISDRLMKWILMSENFHFVA